MCTLPICAPVSSCNVADAWTGASATIRVIAHEVNTIAKTIAQTWAAFAGPIYTVFRVSTLTAAVATVVQAVARRAQRNGPYNVKQRVWG